MQWLDILRAVPASSRLARTQWTPATWHTAGCASLVLPDHVFDGRHPIRFMVSTVSHPQRQRLPFAVLHPPRVVLVWTRG
jgi:hypothetical protein